MSEAKTVAAERKQLEQEKQQLADKLGIWGTFNPVADYEQTEEYKRIQEIDSRLSEIVNG